MRLYPVSWRKFSSTRFLRGAIQNEAKGGEDIVGNDLTSAVLAVGKDEYQVFLHDCFSVAELACALVRR